MGKAFRVALVVGFAGVSATFLTSSMPAQERAPKPTKMSQALQRYLEEPYIPDPCPVTEEEHLAGVDGVDCKQGDVVVLDRVHLAHCTGGKARRWRLQEY